MILDIMLWNKTYLVKKMDNNKNQASDDGLTQTMTTNARTRKCKNWKKNIWRFACWNVGSWNAKDQEIMLEINRLKIDICALAETKKKGKGTFKYQNYILVYSGKQKEERASSGVGLLLHEKFEHSINEIKYINDRILIVTLLFENELIYVVSLYTPDISKPRCQTTEFYSELQSAIDGLPNNRKLIIMGDINARIGNQVVQGVKQRFNEETSNENGDILTQFCSHNELRLNNTFFDHKPQHTFTWSNTRGQNSVIDYVITNRSIEPSQILDVRTLSSTDVGSGHSLVLCKMRIKLPLLTKKMPNIVEKLNIESIMELSTKKLYQTRLQEKINLNPIEQEDDVEVCWKKVKNNVIEAAEEALGKRKVNLNKRPNTKPWFTDEVKLLAEEKRKAYLKYRSVRTGQEYQSYVQIRNRVNSKIREIKKEHWLKFTKDMERDLYGAQKKIWKLLRGRKKSVNEYKEINAISKEIWIEHFKQLYSSDGNGTGHSDEQVNDDIEFTISKDQVKEASHKLKNRKAPGNDAITNELIKYGGNCLVNELTALFQKIVDSGHVPEDWRTSITIPIYKKGDKRNVNNYRGITLLGATLKLFTSIIKTEITKRISICEEQQGFRQNRSTTDAIFIIRQIKEKALEYCTPAYLCFIDMTKAFDKVQLEDVIAILKENQISHKITRVIQNLNMNNKTKIRIDGKVTQEIPVSSGIRQGDSLSPLLFNLIMDKIIEEVKLESRGYRMGDQELKIVCYADDAVIMAETENDLQRLLNKYKTSAEKYNMSISIEKTKCLTIAREPLRCKLVINSKPVEQVMKFTYLGVEISSYIDLYQEVFKQTTKAAAISGAMRDIIWNNRNMNIESKVRIYKTCVRPIMTYAAETRADTRRTKNLLRTNEMKILRRIAGKTRLDRIRNDDIRGICQTEDIVRWTRQRRRMWNGHVQRMEHDRIARIASNLKPHGIRPPGRPPKRWRECWTSTSQE